MLRKQLRIQIPGPLDSMCGEDAVLWLPGEETSSAAAAGATATPTGERETEREREEGVWGGRTPDMGAPAAAAASSVALPPPPGGLVWSSLRPKA